MSTPTDRQPPSLRRPTRQPAEITLGWIFILAAACGASAAAPSAPPTAQPSAAHLSLAIPKLAKPPTIDGDLGEWREFAWNDGVWDLFRVRAAPWYDGGRINRLTDHGREPPPDDDLSARYYVAWDDHFLYLGAEVHDNVNDTTDPQHEPKRWYYKDAIAWFIEAPRDDLAEKFAEGNNGFCFVIDPKKPDHGAWWRHGAPGRSYVEEPLPKSAVAYAIRMNPWGKSAGDFTLEARIDLATTLGKADRRWTPPKPGEVYSLCIVHTDPDGGDYGGHLIIYGTGDNDGTWARAVLTGPQAPIERKPR